MHQYNDTETPANTAKHPGPPREVEPGPTSPNTFLKSRLITRSERMPEKSGG